MVGYICLWGFRYDVSKKEWKNYVHNEKDEKSLSNNKVLSVFEDSRRNVWLTTQEEESVCSSGTETLHAMIPVMDCRMMWFTKLQKMKTGYSG